MRGGLAVLVVSLTLAAACGKPESIELAGSLSGPFYTTAPVPLPRATVIDDRGRVMSPQPEVTWQVTPPHVARVVNGELIPTTSGTAELRASVPELGTPARVGFSVRLVDDVDVKCPADNCSVKLGESIALRGFPLAQGGAVGEMPLRWHAEDPSILRATEAGTFVGMAPGRSKVTVSAGGVTASIEVSVVAPTDRIIVTCESTGDSVEANVNNPEVAAGSACVLAQLSEDRLRLEAFAGTARAEAPVVSWRTTSERVVGVEEGLLRGLTLGSAVVSAEVGPLRVSFPVEVQERNKFQSGCYGLRDATGRVAYRMRLGAVVQTATNTLRCVTPSAVKCTMSAVHGHLLTREDAARLANNCCCTLIY